MRKNLGLAIAFALLCLLPASAAELNLAADPLWKALMSDPIAAGSYGEGSGLDSACTATAECGATSVSCSGSGTCTAVDQNCSLGQQGYVTCDSVTTYCPSCPLVENCTQYNTASCQYTWDAVRSCCVAGPHCPDSCSW